MKYNLYAMRDVKTGYLTPTVEISEATAKRNFAYAVSRKDSLFAYSPADYSLYQVGIYDTDTGNVEPCIPAIFICEATDYVKEE